MEPRSSALAIRSGLDALLRWDAAMVTAAARFERRGLRVLMRGLTRAGDTGGWIVHGIVVAALLDVPQHAIAVMAVAGAVATAASQVAKRIFRRQRPSLALDGFVPRAENPDPFSFPSGHSSVAIAVATAAVANHPLLGGLETVLACSIAVSRVWLGAHYPVDVLGGAALGFACGLATATLMG